ncbi:hypothetical protein [Desulfosarcina sp.]|uniref:hypothetical protein n=1 Tax=Desulfosarcina sp. TaxID=2027861 RepID=UPI003970AE6B
MVDVTPYIIVDNKIIAPIGWSTGSISEIEKQKESQAQDFGIVDRVTISKEARDKSSLYQAQAEDNSPITERLPNKPAVPTRTLLTYSRIDSVQQG